ncbi:MAG: hypothetical protein U5Q44_12000 [Dehalococcoidia bacterium]|nr:hypothetical protein [Dehalococcoidia bacterium]
MCIDGDDATLIDETASPTLPVRQMPASDVTCTFTNVYSVPALTLVKELDTTGDPDPPDADQWTLTAVPGPSGRVRYLR